MRISNGRICRPDVVHAEASRLPQPGKETILAWKPPGIWRVSARMLDKAIPGWRTSMEAAYISALAALAGTAIGGLTSFATSWTTLQAQGRAQRLANERDKREALFGRFLEEAAKLYADALQNKRDEASALIVLYALIGRIRLISSARVVESADMWRASLWTPIPRRT